MAAYAAERHRTRGAALVVRELDDADAIEFAECEEKTVEGVALDVDSGQFGFGDFDTAWIARAIEVAGNGESFAGRGGGDQLDDDLMADERLAAPVLGDVGEQSVLDAVPLAGAGRQMDDRHGEARLVGEALQLAFPQMNAGAVAAAAIGRDQETSRIGIAGPFSGSKRVIARIRPTLPAEMPSEIGRP